MCIRDRDKGFYKDEGLDVTIKAGGPDIAPPQVIAGGGADILIEWMPAALASREKGLNLVNIAQPFKRSGMMLTCRKDSGINSPADFPNKTLGVWFYGNEYPFLSWMSKLGLATDGSDGGVTVLKQGFNVDPILQAGIVKLGGALFSSLITAGKQGVVTNAIYDAYTPARAYPNYHG